jgi:hypothetical protein
MVITKFSLISVMRGIAPIIVFLIILIITIVVAPMIVATVSSPTNQPTAPSGNTGTPGTPTQEPEPETPAVLEIVSVKFCEEDQFVNGACQTHSSEFINPKRIYASIEYKNGDTSEAVEFTWYKIIGTILSPFPSDGQGIETETGVLSTSLSELSQGEFKFDLKDDYGTVLSSPAINVRFVVE